MGHVPVYRFQRYVVCAPPNVVLGLYMCVAVPDRCGSFEGDDLWEEQTIHRGLFPSETCHSQSDHSHHFPKMLSGRQGRVFNGSVGTEWIYFFFFDSMQSKLKHNLLCKKEE